MVVPDKISHAGKSPVAGQGWPTVGRAFQGPTLEGFSCRAVNDDGLRGANEISKLIARLH